MKVSEATRKAPVTVDAAQTIAEVADLMDAAAVGAVVVLNGTGPVGIVTDRDLVVRGMARRAPLDARVDSIMSTDLQTLDADADLRDALAVFNTHAVRRIPILEEGRVMGMITVDDLMIDLISDCATLVRPVTGQVIFGHPEVAEPVPA